MAVLYLCGGIATHVSATIIRNGRVIDPANRRDEVGDLFASSTESIAARSRNSGAEVAIEGSTRVDSLSRPA